MERKRLIETAKNCAIGGCMGSICPLYYVEHCRAVLLKELAEELEENTLVIKVKKGNEK